MCDDDDDNNNDDDDNNEFSLYGGGLFKSVYPVFEYSVFCR